MSTTPPHPPENSPGTAGQEPLRLPGEMGLDAFMATFGGVYEHSPWIARQVYAGGLDERHNTPEGLHDAMQGVVDGADKDAQRALLQAHPDLAGKLAVGGELTADSAAEQSGAGLDRCSPEEFSQFQSLNDRYRKKFGFPFILAVRGKGRQFILDAFRRRVENPCEAEFAEALRQVHRIAHLRIQTLFEQPCLSGNGKPDPKT